MTTASEAEQLQSGSTQRREPEPAIADEAAADQAEKTGSAEAAGSVLGAVDDWLAALRTALARAVDIAALETRLAALNLAYILALAVACGLLLAAAWLALLAATVAGLHELGLSWPAALLLVAATNFALAIAGGYAVFKLSNHLLFKTVRNFIARRKTDAESAPQNTPPAP